MKKLDMPRGFLTWLAILLVPLSTPVEAELVADYLMVKDPEFVELARVKDFRRDFKGLWRQALERPEADYQRLAAETVARAHQHGIPHLVELAPVLRKILTAPSTHPSARFAAARALIVLESRDASAELLEAGHRHGADLRQLIEPALGRWNFAPMREAWFARLEAGEITPQDLILAIRGLGVVRDSTALRTIVEIARDPLRPSHIRLEAAQAAGEMADSGLESDADGLARDRRQSPLINRLCAARLLTRHSSEPARQLLLELAVDPEPSLAAAAMRRLLEIDPELVVPLAEKAMQNGDPRVREAGARAYIERPSPERIVPLARLLDDDHPSVRQLVAERLYHLAENPQLNDVIRAESMRVLAGERWQGRVQATLVLGMLDHKPAADRFVELLEVERRDVMIHAAWGLRKLAEPRTIPAILDKIRRQTAERARRTVSGLDEQVAHLFEACGKMLVKEADPLALPYVPKDESRTMDYTRSAAIWALGRLRLGVFDESLADALILRVLDDNLMPPESPLVKQMCVVTLVRIKATGYSSALKRSIIIHMRGSALDLAARWAVRELTGEELPPPVPLRYPEGLWFLEPLDSSTTP